MLTTVIPSQQLFRGVAANVSTQILDSAGAPATGLTVTVTVTTAAGTVLYTDSACTESGGSYTKALLAADVADLNLLTCTWKVATVTRNVTTAEVISAPHYTAAEVQTVEQDRSNTAANFTQIRMETEAECERICQVAFVPRYRRAILDGSGRRTLQLPDGMIRTVRSVRVYTDATNYTALDAGELASITPQAFGTIERRDSGYFAAGCQNIVVEYEHGYDYPPPDVKRAEIRRHRTRSNAAVSGIPDKAMSFTAENGATYRLAVPDMNHTGDPEVDAVYLRYAKQSSRPLVG